MALRSCAKASTYCVRLDFVQSHDIAKQQYDCDSHVQHVSLHKLVIYRSSSDRDSVILFIALEASF